MFPEEQRLLTTRSLQPLPRPRQPRIAQQSRVLQKPHKHTTQHPRHRTLRQPSITPHRKRLRRPTGITRRLMLRDQPAAQLRVSLGPLTQVHLQPADKPLAILEQQPRIDHPNTLAVEGQFTQPSDYGADSRSTRRESASTASARSQGSEHHRESAAPSKGLPG